MLFRSAPQGLKQITVEWGDPERTWLKEGDHRYAPTSDVGKRWPTEPAPGC